MNEQLLNFAGAWKGDDLQDMLNLVYETRSDVSFTSLDECKQNVDFFTCSENV